MTDDPSARFAAELRRLRAERGLSYRRLAELATQGKSYLEDQEKAASHPTPRWPRTSTRR